MTIRTAVKTIVLLAVYGTALALAAVRRYLPATGCNADEVISIARRSRFFKSPINDTDSIISFESRDIRVQFHLGKDEGRVHKPSAFSTGVPSS